MQALASLAEADRALFKQVDDDNDLVVITTEATIFHPQGGGQPSDIGSMQRTTTDDTPRTTTTTTAVFAVSMARHDADGRGTVLHLGRFTGGAPLRAGDAVEQRIDAATRDLHSRLHTGGHVLGAAVRRLLAHSVAGFAELKASHAPGAASCEFAGLIDGARRAAIQAQVDALVAAALPVEVRWWGEDEFRAHAMPLPAALPPPWRVVEIVGAGCYPCGGTHVADTAACGPVEVRKIGRNKGVSRVSYAMT